MVLKPAFIGWPQVEKYDLDVRHRSDDSMVCYVKFAACYAARRFLIDVSRSEEEWTLQDDETILLNDRLMVVSSRAKEIFEHAMTQEEAAWRLPIPYPAYAAAAGGYALDRRKAEEEARQSAEETGQVAQEEKKQGTSRSSVLKTQKTGNARWLNPALSLATRVRILAKAKSVAAHGTKEKWRDYRAQAEREISK